MFAYKGTLKNYSTHNALRTVNRKCLSRAGWYGCGNATAAVNLVNKDASDLRFALRAAQS